MTWVSIAAMSFVIWWLVLFAVLPFGLRTQDDDEDVTLGTVSSAPRGPHMRRAVLWTTVITALLILALYGVTRGLGLGIDDIPRIVPDFSNKV
jgi:predicted secreted protein